jgi:cysteine-S-conjugate beta-lyase
MTFDFDEIIERRGTHSAKWDMMEPLYGVDPEEGLAMWVADMDFRAPPSVNAALRAAAEHGVHGYFGDDRAYRTSVVDWLDRRHGWEVDPSWIVPAHGLVAGVGLCAQAFTDPDQSVILFTPVYHAFHKVLNANRRRIVQSEMKIEDGRYVMDLETLAKQLDGTERMVVLCSPHNPGGRVWAVEELRELATFCEMHDLILLSDEIHHDLVYPGAKHTVMNLAAPEIAHRLVTCAATTKTFNIAGALTGNVIIQDPKLRARFQAAQAASGATINRMGALMATAAYEGGELWLEALISYLDGNRKIFDRGVNQIAGVRSMPLQSTYLSWVDFRGTGLSHEEIVARVRDRALIAVNEGRTFGQGGEGWLRFNFATPRSRVSEAVARLQNAFSDLG